MQLVKLFLLLSLQFYFQEQVFSQYEIILERVETLLGDEDQFFENVNVRVKRANKTQYVANGIYHNKRPLGDDVKVGFKAYNLAGGQYKLLFGRLVGPMCEFVYEDHMRTSVEEFFAATNATWHWGMCPFPSGYIFLQNYFPTSIGDYLPPYLPGGERWKLSYYFVYPNDTENILGGVSFYAILRSNYSLLRYGG